MVMYLIHIGLIATDSTQKLNHLLLVDFCLKNSMCRVQTNSSMIFYSLLLESVEHFDDLLLQLHYE